MADPVWENVSEYDAVELRLADLALVAANGTSLSARSGVRPGDPGLAVTLSGTTINVSAGVAAIAYPGQGLYRGVLDSAASPGTYNTPHSTYTRVDLVYLRVWDDDVDSSGLRQADPVYLAGTASATPSAPSIPAGQIGVALATITVPPSGGGAASVSTAVRPFMVAPGGILPSSSAPSSPYTGQFYDNGTDLLRWNGSAWDTYQKVQSVAWTTPTLASGYTANGNSNGTPQYRKITISGAVFVQWRGGLNVTYSSGSPVNSGQWIASVLASAYRPLSRRTVPAACSATSSSSLSVKLDFDTDGSVAIINDSGVTPPWVSLNGVMYSID